MAALGPVVTDPAILKELGAPPTTDTPAAPSLGPVVTDPAVLAQLNGSAGAGADADNTAVDYTKSAASGVGEGAAQFAGMPVNLYNAIGDAFFGRAPAWAAEHLGMPGVADWIRQNGYHDWYPGSGQATTDALKQAGLDYTPQTPGEANVKNVLSGATTGALASLTGGLGSAAEALPMIAGKGALAGAGAATGSDVASGANKSLLAPEWQMPDGFVRFLGSMAGGLGASGLANRSILYEKPPVMEDFEQAGVQPHFATDVNASPGAVGRKLSNFLPQRFGASKLSSDNAQATQDQLSDYAKRLLEPSSVTMQQAGQRIQDAAENSIDLLNQGTDAAFQRLNEVIDPNVTVVLDHTKQAVGDLVNRAGDPDLKQMVQNPTFERFAPLLDKRTLTWADMDVLRQAVGRAMQGAQGNDVGLLKQMYRGVMDDLRDASKANPEWEKLYNDAAATAEKNNDQIEGILGFVNNRDSPETLPDWLTAQAKKGGTRLESLLNSPGFKVPADDNFEGNFWNGDYAGADLTHLPLVQQEIGKYLLASKAQNGDFNLNRLMKFWSQASPEAKAQLTLDPQVADGMARLERLYGATSRSQGLIGREPATILNDPITMSMEGAGSVAALGHVANGHLSPGPVAAAMMADPAINYAAAKVAQSPALVSRFASPVAGNMMPFGQKALPTAAQTFAEAYEPDFSESGSDKVTHTAQWLGEASPQAAAAYVGQRLGPQAAQQLQGMSGQAYKAALFGLLSRPETRHALFGDEG